MASISSTGYQEDTMAQLPGEGTIAGPDDIVPEGQVITRKDIERYRAQVEAAARKAGMPAPTWND